jgi:predicted nucleotide-binding protein (sugar kinase/HSP70/actin superfamily)
VFAEMGVPYFCPLVNFADVLLLKRQMFEELGGVLGLSEEENARAVDAGFGELEAYELDIQRRAREVLEQLEAEKRVGLVLLARPYHHDPGLNHEILEEFQKLGYPIFSQSTLPMDEDILERLFGDEVRAGVIRDPLEIQDVWKNSYSGSTNQKVWAAKFTARHPNLVALELSSFKCGHDAPIYSVIEGIIERSGTPYFSFKDIDENKPSGSIKIRVETIHYFLKRYVEDMRKQPLSEAELEAQLAAYEQQVRDEMRRQAELAQLGARHREMAADMATAGKLLPMAAATAEEQRVPDLVV